MDFQQRLQKAIERGQRSREDKAREEAARAMTEEEYKNLHSRQRLELSDYAEACLGHLADQFPGFQKEIVMGDRGWGAAITRDDVNLRAGGRGRNLYSRLEVAVRPFSSYHVLDLAAKGTIRNKEVFTRNHYELLGEVDLDSFRELTDLWVLEYAEKYAADR